MQVQILYSTELRPSFIIIYHILEVNVRKHLSRKRLKLVVRCDDGCKIDDLSPRNCGIVRIVLVHLQHIIRNLLQAHGCHVQAPIHSRAIDALSQQRLASLALVERIIQPKVETGHFFCTRDYRVAWRRTCSSRLNSLGTTCGFSRLRNLLSQRIR